MRSSKNGIASAKFDSSSGRSGRGPTRLMSPVKTFQNCGSSSMRVLRKNLPMRVEQRPRGVEVDGGADERIQRDGDRQADGGGDEIDRAFGDLDGRSHGPESTTPVRDWELSRAEVSCAGDSPARARHPALPRS